MGMGNGQDGKVGGLCSNHTNKPLIEFWNVSVM